MNARPHPEVLAPMQDSPVGVAARGALRQTQATVERRADGTVLLRSTAALGDYPARLADRLVAGAQAHPARSLFAMRGGDPASGRWRHIRYDDALDAARRIGEALVQRGLGAERPVLILSGNDLDHALLALGATYAGVPYVPVSPAYSLISQDFARLRHIVELVTPGLVFAADGDAYARAIDAVVPAGTEVVLAKPGATPRAGATRFDTLLATAPTDAVARAHAATGPDTMVKLLFTSGSTNLPKAVIHTNRMLCANQQMIVQAMPCLADAPVLVDWLPWHHTFGGNHNVGIALYNGGTLYIDQGKPIPSGFGPTLANLKEVSPTVYFNVPKGWESLCAAMEADGALRARFYAQVQLFFFAGAGLSQAVWDRLDRLSEQTVGRRIPVMSGLGMTETGPSSMFTTVPEVRSGDIGLPCDGCEVKIVPMGEKSEVRFRGPHVMPGYWRAADQTRAAFDEEGYYRTGDAVCWVDPAHPERGLRFDGRIAEDFKLATGTFVSVGPLRARILEAGAACVQDVVIAGMDRDEIGVLLIPRLDACEAMSGLPHGAPIAAVLESRPVRACFQRLLDTLYAAGTGSANRVARAIVLREPPSIDRGEITDKGSINQRAVLAQRAHLVDAMYAGRARTLLLPTALTK